MSVKPLNGNHLEFLRLKGGCAGSSESVLVKIPHCWMSSVTAHFLFVALHPSQQLAHIGRVSSSKPTLLLAKFDEAVNHCFACY